MKDFIPAARLPFLTSFYDLFMRVFFQKTFEKISSTLNPREGAKIIDIGCGPGNLLVEIHKKYPHAKLTGLDIDPAILKIVRKKLEKYDVHAELIEASAMEIPYPDHSFDIAVSSLMIHHLEPEEDKRKFLAETFRILKPGAKFYLFDYAKPVDTMGKFLSGIIGHFEDIRHAIHGKYWDYMKDAGFRNLHSPYRSLLFELIEGEK